MLFELTLASGETLYYDFAQSIKISMEILGTPITTDISQRAGEAIRTLNVDPDGSMMVEVVLEDFRQAAGSQTQEVFVSPVTLTVRPNGKAIDIGAAHGTGQTDWWVDRGRLLGITQEVIVEGALEVTGQGQVVRGTMRETISTQVQALAPESITVPAVSPDMLITAGKGIGTYTIDQSGADLTSQLGSPTSITGDGNRPTVLTWPNGLRGHVGATEQNRLLSLQISNDRRFRADRGIGFGSSRRAVLTAYGLTPTRVKLSGPGGTDVYVLVYNDEGIAFAIASMGPPVELSAERPPANTVAGVTVFPPGDAGKISPLP